MYVDVEVDVEVDVCLISFRYPNSISTFTLPALTFSLQIFLCMLYF